MSENYTGPWCNIKLADGSKVSAKGTGEAITGQLRGGGLHELEDVYGRPVTIGADHVVRIDQMQPGEFEQIS